MTPEDPIIQKPLPFMAGDPAKAGARVSLVLNGKWRSFLLASDQGARLIELLRAVPQDIEAIGELADIQTWVAKKSNGRVAVDELDRLRLDGKLIDYGLTGRVGAIIEQGVPFESLTNFIERLSRNPDPTVAEDLYRFMEKGNLPLDPEGFILAFKKVDEEYWSYRAGVDGKVRYVPGTSPSMPREDCDPNRMVTCSRGLHACSYEYLKVYYGGRGKLVIVRIDPEHVTAIPADHNDQKLRCCQMEVLADLSEDEAKDHFQSVVDARYPAKNVVEAAIEAMVEARGEEPPIEDGEEPSGPADAVNDWVAETGSVIVAADEAEEAWLQAARDAGDLAGAKDHENDYECDPALEDNYPVDMPVNLRGDYCIEYARSYVTGFTKAQAEAELLRAWTPERAVAAGGNLGTTQANRDYPHYDNEVDDDIRDELIGWVGEKNPGLVEPEEHALVVLFDRSARDAYHTKFNALEDGTV